MTKKEFSLEWAGRTLTATFSDLADQTNGSVLVRLGDTIVLATAVMGKSDRLGVDYFPLTVDYEEKFYAAGKIMGSRFIKRENRPSDEAILSGRIVDRTIRPLFDQEMRREVQVVVMVLSIDDINDPDVVAVIAASLALGTSDIPWGGPVSAVRIGSVGGNYVINPSTKESLAQSALEILVCGKDGNVNMIEAEGKEAPENIVEGALVHALGEIEKIQDWQKKVIKEVGKTKQEVAINKATPEMHELFRTNLREELRMALFNNAFTKSDTSEVTKKWLAMFAEKYPEANLEVAARVLEHETDQLVHDEAITNNKRPDGRQFDEVRPLYTQAGGLSPMVHGMGIFYRGATHVISFLTLGGPGDAQIVEGMEVSEKKRFMHHYNFPPFSVGETGRMGGQNRRAIGHGALAEKALRATLPNEEQFPYTIRLVSESTASNGSTSMASVCASTLALMDGGVPIVRPTAGIAMGLMMEGPNDQGPISKYKVLTDIQGAEDHFGDMDFKVAGTAEGITAIQLDIKIGGIPPKILSEALTAAREARLKILAKIAEALPAPRPDIAPSAPKIISMKVEVDQIGLVIGSGGKTINKIIDETGADVTIEDDGRVYVTGKAGSAENALAMVKELVTPLVPGTKFVGEVVKLFDFGAVVKIGHWNEGLVHVSEMAPFRIDKVSEAVSMGEKVPVMVLESDERGKVRLSIKAADPKWAETKGVKPGTGAGAPPRRDDHRGPPRR